MKHIQARVGAGATAMCALVWVLWPSDWSTVLQPEPLFVFSVALAVWVSTELFNGENYSLAPKKIESGSKTKALSENDLRNSRQLLSYHKFAMRDLLKTQDLAGYFDYTYLSELHAFVHANKECQFEFLNKEIAGRWTPVIAKFSEFSRFMAQNSTPDHIAGREMIRLDYHKVALMVAGAVDKPSKAEEGNVMANEAWLAFQNFIDFLKEHFPATTDSPSEEIWFYSRQQT